MQQNGELKRVFHEAVALPNAERSAFLDRACSGNVGLRRNVDRLVAAHDEAGEFLSAPYRRGDDLAPDEPPGALIGRYRLMHQLGEGGFGTVWLAEQDEPIRREVAIKVLRRGMDTQRVISRFEQERQVLALMDHPNIAKVLDAGETPSGRPFFAMELVRGVPITQFCDREQFDARKRLQVFVQVCNAVHHAHQKGIIHRDLKPANVLVTVHDGVPVPKVIDFGIAKAIRPAPSSAAPVTDLQQLLGTPEYMSPEQAASSGHDVDTRSDIYSLGILLYELLTGTLPFDRRTLEALGQLEILRVIREDEPPKPSTRISTLGERGDTVAEQRRTDLHRLGGLLRGDLDCIVMKALEKDRARRYVSADAFAADVERHLRSEPVLATPQSTPYRLRKYVRRNKIAVTAASLVVAALVVGLAGATWGFLDARTQRARAETGEAAAKRESARANAVLELVTEALSSASPHDLKGRGYTVRQLLDDFDRNLGARFTGEPEIEATVRRLLGNSYRGLGLYAEAEEHLTRALALRLQVLGHRDERVADSLGDQALLLRSLGRYAEALETLDEAKAIVVELEGAASADVASIQLIQADLWHRLGDATRALELAQEALVIRRGLFGDAHHSVALCQSTISDVFLLQGDLVAAEELARLAVEKLRARHGDGHPEVVYAIARLAGVLSKQQKLGEAEALYRESLALKSQLYGLEHTAIAADLNNLSIVLANQGKAVEAEELQRRALAMQRQLLGEEHRDVATSMNNLAELIMGQGRAAEAEELHRQVLALMRASSSDPLGVATSLGNLGIAHWSQGEFDAAEVAFMEAVQIFRKLLGDGHPKVANVLHSLARALNSQGRYAEAEDHCRRAVEIQRTKYGDENRQVASFRMGLALILLFQGKTVEAEEMSRQAVATMQRLLGDDHSAVATSQLYLAVVLQAVGKLDEAEELHRTSLANRRSRLGDSHPSVAKSLLGLAAVLSAQGEHVDAADHHRRGLAILAVARPELTAAPDNLVYVLDAQSQCLAARREQLDSEHPDLPAVLDGLAFVRAANGRLEEAVALHREALKLRRARLGDDHFDVITSEEILAAASRALDRAAEDD